MKAVKKTIQWMACRPEREALLSPARRRASGEVGGRLTEVALLTGRPKTCALVLGSCETESLGGSH